ncbi:MAG: dethiobiotin synthase [Chthoniobacterales bacterium]
MNFFITGTDTDCGKTFVTALLVRTARAAGIDVLGAKPVCCGPRDDVAALSAANGGADPLDALNPIWLQTPAAPRACELLGEPSPDYEAALFAMRTLASRHEHFLCEGAGGWLVPLRAGYTIADLAIALGWPVLLVVGNKLGALNHALLTVQGVRSSGLKLAGVILNDIVPPDGPAACTNRQVLEEALGFRVLAHVGYGASDLSIPSLLTTPV